jgi:ATP-dependent Lhr-like helicase
MQWLLAWQHVAPGTQTRGEAGTLEVLRQLQGLEAPARAWERDILPRRIAAYDPADLDRLCLSGAIGWGRLSRPTAATADGPVRRVVPTSVTPITFFVRDDAEWMPVQRTRERDEPSGLSRNARGVLQHLHRAGASFFADVVRGGKLLKAEVETALWELVAAGLVTADGFDNLRALTDPRRRAGRGSGREARPRNSAGRWALLEPPVESASDRSAATESACWMLLRRYGVVFREVLARESNLPSWRELLIVLRRLEDRGEVRGGRFVDGLVGEQFSLPIALESLRAFRRRAAPGEIVTIAAADPLNLVGTLVPGTRVPTLSDRTVSFRDGVPFEEPGALSRTRNLELGTWSPTRTA